MKWSGTALTAPTVADTWLGGVDVAHDTHSALADRLWSKVDRTGGPDACWPFTGLATMRSGHKQMWWAGTMNLVHRLAFVVEVGPIPDGMCVCHSCDNPPCCNPAHLWLGTVAENNADRDRKGRGVPPPPGSRTYPKPGPVKHGTTTAYVKHKCRCDECKARMREYRASRRVAGMTHLGTPPFDLPAAQVEALEKVEWPDAVRAVDA